MNRGRLIARVSAEIGLSALSGSDELTLLGEWANEGVVDVLLETRCHVDLGDLTFQPGVNDYRLDTSVLAVLEIDPGGDVTDVDIVSLDELYELRRGGGAGATVIAVEGDLLLVHPTPTATAVLRYVFVAKPALMTDDGHDPEDPTYGGIPSEYHHAIEEYMDYHASRYDGTRAPLTPRDYAQIYADSLKNIRRRHRKKGYPGLPPLRVGYPSRRRVGGRNDTYPAV